tara:strand:- start:291 stop:1133 length:843 start_codon:yes stop_codon:yes gene_type:complete
MKLSKGILFVLVLSAFGCNDDPKNTDRVGKNGGVIIEKNDEYADFTDLGDGRLIRVEREGKGEKITGDVVTIFHYKGWRLPKRRLLVDSYESRYPAQVQIGDGQLVEGLEKTMLEHRVGSVFQLFVPYELAYGDTVIGEIPPKTDLLFDVSILGVKEAVPYFDTTGIKPELKANGLEIYRVSPGKGEKPKNGDYVKVHYHGFYEDGRKFDSSFDRGEPIQFQVGQGQVILGWDQLLPMLKVGERVTVKIPFFLAYGEAGNATIPPKTDLMFNIELVDIKR